MLFRRLQSSQYVFGLSGSLLMRTPVALKIALAMQAIGGTQAISPAPFGAVGTGTVLGSSLLVDN